MELDDESVRLRAGDVLVQRGTIHNWVNRSNETCIIAFVLIDALPATIGGEQIQACRIALDMRVGEHPRSRSLKPFANPAIFSSTRIFR